MTSATIRPPGSPLPPRDSGARSYLDDGRVVVWSVPGGTEGYACDAERFDRSPRTLLVETHGLPSDPFQFALEWTRREVRAKLDDRPIVIALRDDSRADDLHLESYVHPREKVVLTVGARASLRDGLRGVSVDRDAGWIRLR